MRTGLLVNARLSAANFLWETTLITKIGCCLLSLFFLLSLMVDIKEVIAITPGHLIPPNFWIWTVVTHQFVESNFILFSSNCVVLLFSVKFLESIWGVSGFLMFFGLVTSLSGVLTFFVYLFLYMSTFDISYLFDVHVYGLHAYIGGILVCFKQSRGDQMVVGSVGLNVKNLPLLYSIILILFKILGLIPGAPVCLSLLGMLVAWVYLRFYQSHNKGRGDQAAHFAFKTFFPKLLQGPVGVMSNAIYQLLLTLRICRKTSYRYDVGAPSKFTITLSGVDAFDAERRRNKAIKALDERLQKQDRLISEESEWPMLDDPDPESKDDENVPKDGNTSSLTSSSDAPSNDVKINMETSSENSVQNI